MEKIAILRDIWYISPTQNNVFCWQKRQLSEKICIFRHVLKKYICRQEAIFASSLQTESAFYRQMQHFTDKYSIIPTHTALYGQIHYLTDTFIFVADNCFYADKQNPLFCR
jgi:hypothetical protein